MRPSHSPFIVTLMPYSPMCRPTSALTKALLKDLYVAFVVTLASAQSQVKLRAADRQRDGEESCSNPTVIYQTGKDQIIKSKLTHNHHTDEEADDYPEHPEQPLKSRGGGF